MGISSLILVHICCGDILIFFFLLLGYRSHLVFLVQWNWGTICTELQITSSLSCTEEVGIYLHSTLPVNLHLFCNLHDIHLPYNQCKPPLWVCIQAFIQVTWFDKGWWLIKVSKYPHKCFGFFDDQNFLLLLIRKKVQKIRFKIPCPHDLYF